MQGKKNQNIVKNVTKILKGIKLKKSGNIIIDLNYLFLGNVINLRKLKIKIFK